MQADGPDPKHTALAHFKDWSNYLLVSTVAGVGWIAQAEDGDPVLLDLAQWGLSLSLVFGIFALALVPLVAEQMRPEHKSIYDVQAEFRLVRRFRFYMPQACRPQHILFIVGAILYCLASTDGFWRGRMGEACLPWGVAALCLTAVFFGVLPWHQRRP